MAWNQVRALLGKVVVGALPGVIAGGIAIFVSWNFVSQHREESGKSCSTRPCFVILDTRTKDMNERLLKIESKSHPSTAKRFNSDDANALELRMIKCHNRVDWKFCLAEEKAKYERSKK